MGITIHYSGRAKSHDALSQILHIATMFSAEREWMFAIYEDPLGVWEDFDPECPDFKDRDGPYRGIVIRPDSHCESVRLNFHSNHEFGGSTKTQFAPFDVHSDIVKLLHAIEPFLSELTVIDESGFWETKDAQAAKAHFAESDTILDELDQKLHDGGMVVDPGLPGDPYTLEEDGDLPPDEQPYG